MPHPPPTLYVKVPVTTTPELRWMNPPLMLQNCSGLSQVKVGLAVRGKCSKVFPGISPCPATATLNSEEFAPVLTVSVGGRTPEHSGTSEPPVALRWYVPKMEGASWPGGFVLGASMGGGFLKQSCCFNSPRTIPTRSLIREFQKSTSLLYFLTSA